MLKLEQYKQLFKILADEVNIKEIRIGICQEQFTDKKFELVYKKDTNDLFLELGGERVMSPTLNAKIPEICKLVYATEYSK